MQNILVFATGLFVALGGVYLYSQIGRPDLAQVQPVQTPAPANATSGTPTVDTVDNKISELEARMQANPNDAQGWRMLGWAYFSMGRYDKSVSAYEKALGLSPADVDVKSALAEAQVMASGNVVTPKAKATFEEVLRTNPKDDRSRFYLALAMEQSGNAAGALDSWLALFADAPADAGWIGEVRSHIESLGKQLGKDVSAQLAAKTPAVTPPGPETNPEAAAAIQQMPAGDQQEMIKGMVQRLADRLKANPKDVEGWKRLIRARVVLNDPVGAKQALADGNAAFGDEPATQQMLKDAAAADGISLD
jgi:cytochrome c-type biogenesis protein CcmH